MAGPQVQMQGSGASSPADPRPISPPWPASRVARRAHENRKTLTMFVIVGWLVAIACIFGVFIAHGGNIGVVLHALPFELITIFGGAVGAFVATNQPKVLKATARGLAGCFKGSK